jgi:hypothetical protein
LPMRLSSHAVCHDEEGKWFRQRIGRGGRYDPLGDQERIFVRSVLASYAWIQVGSHLQGEHWRLCMYSLTCTCERMPTCRVRGARRLVVLSYHCDCVSFLPVTRLSHLNRYIGQFVASRCH